MLSGRMLRIIKYLQVHKQTSYKMIAKDLDIKERYVRYDIDRINDYLSLHKNPLIQKKSKGIIVFLHDMEELSLLQEESFIYSSKERVSLMTFILLFNHKNLKINHLCDDFKVSRSTVKNDMNVIEGYFLKYNIELYYEDSFDIKGYNRNIVDIMAHELMKYLYLYREKNKGMNSFELYAIKRINEVFKDSLIEKVINWVSVLFDERGYQFNDNAYDWYVSNLLVLVWFVINEEATPKGVGFNPLDNHKYSQLISDFEILICHSVDCYLRGALINLLDYIDDDEGITGRIDSVHIQSICFQLIAMMSKELDCDFEQDYVLVTGLFKHMIPLIKRVVCQKETIDNIHISLPQSDIGVFEILKGVIKDIDVLKDIKNENEKIYLGVHFIASMKRMKKSLYKRILIVCHHGYGSSIMLKESLINEFQVKVVDVIPSYKLSTYMELDKIDYIISTLSLPHTYGKGNVVVNPILSEGDYYKLKSIGLKRKEVRVNYQRLNTDLNFLDQEDRYKVLSLIQKELGHQEVHILHNEYRISHMIQEENILVVDKAMEWQEVVKEVSDLLEKQHYVDKDYGQSIIDQIKNIGFYCVTDEYFALFHGKSGRNTNQTGMSLIVNKQVMEFGDKRVHIVFCLSSIDNKDQIPAMILLMRLIKKTNLLEDILMLNNSKEVIKLLRNCENEVFIS